MFNYDEEGSAILGPDLTMSLRLGRYETLRQIGSGGMASVHLGRVVGEGGFERLVAIKLMHAHLVEDPEFVSMFLDEGRLAASIRHPNVVATLDIDRANEGLFLVMEYVDGPSLYTLINLQTKRNEPMPLPIVLRVFLDCLAGLHAAHELVGPQGQPLNLVHRDISPANVLVGRDGLARITDFGVARAESRLSVTRGGELKGKVPYLAPEQLQGASIDRRSDIWSAGCVLWEMLTLRRLFEAGDQGTLIGVVLAGPKETPTEVSSHVPYNIDRACMRALEGLDDRYRSADAFGRALKDAAALDGIAVGLRKDVESYVEDIYPKAKHSGAVGLSASGSTHPSLSSGGSTLDRSPVESRPNWVSSHPSQRTDPALISTPAHPRPPQRHGALTIGVAVAAAAISGAMVWVATDKASGEADAAGTTESTTGTTTDLEDLYADEDLDDEELDDDDEELDDDDDDDSEVAEPADSSEPDDQATTTSPPTPRPVTPRPRPTGTSTKTKTRTKTKTKKPPPKPTSTTGFRPNKP